MCSMCASQNHKSYSPPSRSPSSNYTSAPPFLKTNNPVTMAIISPNPYAISHLTEIIKEMCNYQKTIIILEGNVTSDCKMLIPKGVKSSFVPKGVRSTTTTTTTTRTTTTQKTKQKNQNFIKNYRRPADLYVV